MRPDYPSAPSALANNSPSNRAIRREYMVLDIETAKLGERRCELRLRDHDEDVASTEASPLKVGSGWRKQMQRIRTNLELQVEEARLETRRFEHNLAVFDDDTEEFAARLGDNAKSENLHAGYNTATAAQVSGEFGLDVAATRADAAGLI